MIDTVKLWIPRDAAGGAFAGIPARLTDVTESRDARGARVGGRVGSMFVEMREGGVMVRNSLAKYVQGQNFDPLTPAGVEAAINSLSDAMGVDVGEAYVTRLDFGFCVPVPCCCCVLNAMGEIPRFTRSQYSGAGAQTVLYAQMRRKLCCYDKLEEARAKGSGTPAGWAAGFDVLRLEEQITEKPARVLKRPALRARELYSRPFLLSLAERWEYEFAAVPVISESEKTKEIMRTILKRSRITEVNKALAGILLSIPEYRSAVDSELSKITDKQQRARLRRNFREAESLCLGGGENEDLGAIFHEAVKAAPRKWASLS